MADKVMVLRERREFGRECIFMDKREVIFTEATNKELARQYILRNPVDRGTELSCQMALSIVNTDNTENVHRGMNHIEGGWPKDLNFLDEEQTVRHRKKIMREDIWGQKLPTMLNSMEAAVKQNAAVNIYQQYFEELDPLPPINEFEGNTVSVFKDPLDECRPINHLSWSSNDGRHIAACYCDPQYSSHEILDPTSYIWDVENSNTPSLKLFAYYPIVCLEYNTKDKFIIVGGLKSGEVAVWDTRYGGESTIRCEREVGHTNRVNAIMWSVSKTNTEFFSGSSDGSVLWWDTRKLTTPIESLLMDPVDTEDQSGNRSLGVSVLEFEPTMATKFMVGTEQGYVYCGSKKGRTATEKIVARIPSHSGRICALERNPSFPKNYLTVGDWCIKVWSEEWRESPIIWTPNQPAPLMAGTWSQTRCSTLFLTRLDGNLDIWDILYDQGKPIFSMQLSDSALYSVRCHESGQFVCTGDAKGHINLVKFSENMLFSGKAERVAFTQMIERETRRERFYEAKIKDAKLRDKDVGVSSEKKIQQPDAENKIVSGELLSDPLKELLNLAEQEFLETAKKETERRKALEVKNMRTPFDDDFDLGDILKPEELEEVRKEKIKAIKKKVIAGILEKTRRENQKQ